MADNNKNTDKNNENDVKNAENAQKNAENKNNENNKAKSVKPVKVRFLTGYWGIYGTFQAGEKASIPEYVAKAFAKDKVCEILEDKE